MQRFLLSLTVYGKFANDKRKIEREKDWESGIEIEIEKPTQKKTKLLNKWNVFEMELEDGGCFREIAN